MRMNAIVICALSIVIVGCAIHTFNASVIIKRDSEFNSFRNRTAAKFYARGLTEFNRCTTKIALIYFDQALSVEHNKFAYAARAQCRSCLWDNKGALKDINEALKLDPVFARGYHERSDLERSMGNIEGSREDAKIAAKLDPTIAKPVTVSTWPIEPRDLIDVDLRLETYNQSIQIDPKFAPHYQGRAFMRELVADQSGALNDYSTAILLDDKDASSLTSRAHLWTDAKKSLDDYTKAIEIDPTNDPAYRNRSFLRGEAGDKTGALDDAQEAIRLDPKDAFNYYPFAWAHYKLGEIETAKEVFDKAIALEPNCFIGYKYRGSMYEQLGDGETAVRNYSTAIELNPNDSSSYRDRAHALCSQGNFKAAVEDVSRAIFLDVVHLAHRIEQQVQFKKL
jgi:tetratricopeptide (TPR) repeat protein